MYTARLRSVVIAFSLAAALLGSRADAQTSTPTLTPVATPTPTPTRAPLACVGARKLYVTWVAKDPQNLRVAFSATGCPEIFDCDTTLDGDLASEPPVAFTITDAAHQSFGKTITDPGIGTGGCPGGKDDYRGVGRLRFVFGTSTTVIGKQRLPQTQTTAPTLTPPIQVDLRDAAGALYTFTVNTCYPRITSTSSGLKCF